MLTLSAIIYGCRKEIKENDALQTSGQSTIKIDIAALKDIYNKAIGSSSNVKTLSSNSTLNFIRTLNVNWDTYTLQKRRDSSIVAEFDMKNDTGLYLLKKLSPGDTIKYINKTTVTFIKFKDGSRLNFFTKIIEDLTLPGSHSVMNNLHYNQVPFGFNGMILYYTLDRKYINGYRYINGGILGTVELTTTPPATSDKSINSIKVNEAVACDANPIYEMKCTGDGGSSGYSMNCAETLVGYSYSCYVSGGGGSVGGDTGGGGGAGGPNSPSPTPPDPCSPPSSPVAVESVSNGRRIMVVQQDPGTGGGGTGTGSNPPCATAQVITNNVNNPCLHRMVDAAVYRDINYDLQKSMDGIFGYSQTNFNLSFVDGPLDPSWAGITDVTGSSGNYDATRNKYTTLYSMDLRITLNSSTLPGGSEEFTTATILHESLHAYFRVTNTSFDHEVMINKYIPWFISALQTIYPAMSEHDAKSLAYGGLTQTGGYAAGIDTSTLNDYLLTNDSFKTAKSGTPCH